MKKYSRILASAVAILTTGILHQPVSASDVSRNPTRPVSLVVPFTAGGITDVTARIVATELGERLGRPVIVENRPGAGGAIASSYVARSYPDGYTLFFGSRGTQITNAMVQKDIDIPPPDAFVSIHAVSDAATVLVAHPSAQPVLDKLRNAMAEIMAKEDIQKKMVELGTIPMTIGGADLDALIKEETKRWSAVLGRISITAE